MEINTHSSIAPNKIRQVIMLALVLGLGFLLYKEMAFMMGGLLGAIALYMLMRKPMFTMVFNWKLKRWVSALLLIICSLIVIVMPFVFIINVLVDRLLPMLEDTSKITSVIKQIGEYVQTKFHIDILSSANLDKVPTLITQLGTKVVGSTLNMVANIIILYFILWFMLMKSGEMERSIRKNLPLKNTNVNRLLKEINAMVVSNAVGIPVLGVIQGILAIIGYSIFGVEHPVLWGIITGIASVVPFVGTTLVWLPVALLAFAKGDSNSGWWLMVWGAVIIGSSDNIIRFVLQRYIADVHPLITVFGVIVGLNLFGFLGLIFGPLLISLFLLLIRIYNDEFAKEADTVEISPAVDTGTHPEP